MCFRHRLQKRDTRRIDDVPLQTAVAARLSRGGEAPRLAWRIQREI
jgi:hypothetical protein